MNLDERLYKAAREIKNAVNDEARLSKEVHWCDLAISDLIHELELSPLNAAELVVIAGRVRDIRRKRRIAKNALAVINDARHIDAYHFGTRGCSLEVKHYVPRVFKELKCGR